MAAPSGQLEAHLLRAHQDDDDESVTDEQQPLGVADPLQRVEQQQQPAEHSVSDQACPKQLALHAWTFEALKQAAHDFFTRHTPEQQRAAARSKACCIACQELGEELVLQLHAFYSSMPASGYDGWYAWSGLVLDTKQSLAERPDDSSSSKRNKRMLLEAAIYKAASDSASASVFRRALSSLCGIALAAELATAALSVAAERSALTGARADARSLLQGLKALADVCPTFLQAVAAVTRMVQCGQTLSMGSLLAVPLPPVARMEASTRRPTVLQLPHLRRCLCSVVQSLRDSVATATTTLTSTADSTAALGSSSGSGTAISSPSSSLLLSALGSYQEELCTALRAFAAAIAHALAAHSDLAPLCAAVHRIAGLMAAGERQLFTALQDATTAARDPDNTVAAAVEPLALQLSDLRFACESALTTVYMAQCMLADAAAPQQAGTAAPATAAAAVAEVASLLSAAGSYYGAEQLDTLAQLQEHATALSASMTAATTAASAQQATDDDSDSMSSSMQGSSVLLEGGSWVQTTAGSSNMNSSAQALYESTGSVASSAAATKADSQDAEQYTDLLVAESGGDDSPDEDSYDKSSSIAGVDSSRSRRSQQQLLGELSYVLCARSSSLPPMRVRGSSQSSLLLHPASPTAAAVAAVAAAEAQSAMNSSSNISSAELANSTSAGGSGSLQLSSLGSSAEQTVGSSSSREARSPLALAVSPQPGASGSSSARQILSPGTPRGGMSLGLLTELRGLLPDLSASVGTDSYSFCGDSDLGAEDAVVVGSVPPD
jgi:trimeric autotransporter adhesin